MKKILLSLMAVVLCITVVAQKNNNSKRDRPFTESRNVGEFVSLSAGSIFDVYILDGNSPVVEIKSTHDVLKYITTEVTGGKLVIKYNPPEKRWFNNTNDQRKIEIYISKSHLNAIQASGSADIYGKGTLTVNDLEISASGSSDVTLNVKVQGMLKCSASGSSDIVLTGTGNDGCIVASGASDITMKNCTLVNATVTASGSSDVSVYASGRLDMEASGASDIDYYGAPQKWGIKKSGSADIKKK